MTEKEVTNNKMLKKKFISNLETACQFPYT